MVINKNSWHYKWLAYTTVMMNYLGNRQLIEVCLEGGMSYREIYELNYQGGWSIPINFCQYWRKALVTHPLIIVINLFLVMIAIMTAINYPMGLVFVAGGVTGVGVVIISTFAALMGFDQVKRKIRDTISSDEPSIISEAYKSYKSNVCTLIDYEDK